MIQYLLRNQYGIIADTAQKLTVGVGSDTYLKGASLAWCRTRTRRAHVYIYSATLRRMVASTAPKRLQGCGENKTRAQAHYSDS
jgi:protein tyrosine phosphatase (PTP) superfamily phosphohydrolase (DUF442 family)